MAASRRELPADVAAAFDRVPEAGDRFAALPPERQLEWLNWIDRARGRRRAARIDEAIRRLLPSATASEEEVAEPAGPPPDRYWWLWLLLLLLLVLGGLLAWWLLTRGNDKSTLPNVIGLRSRAAITRIEDRHLKAAPLQGQSKRPPDVVFAQRPGAGTQLRHGQTVVISISSGRLAVPDVTSLQVAQALRRLTGAGFTNTAVKRVASSRPKGVVVEQSPVAGVTAARGTMVSLKVSSGAKPVIVPQVVGQSQGSAVNALTGLGLKPVLHNVPAAKPAGTVVAQKPAAGKEVDKGSKVTLNVSTGTGPSTTTVATTTTTATTSTTTVATTTTASSARVPRVVGLAQTPALRRLNLLGLRPTVVYRRSSQPVNRVLSQSPAPGATLRRGTRVPLVVSAGPNPQPATSVPNVVGQDQATAASPLRSAGFPGLVLNPPAPNPSQDRLGVE